MINQSAGFPQAARRALNDEGLAEALNRTRDGLVGKRQRAVQQTPQFAALRASAALVREHALVNLAEYLSEFETHFTAQGGNLHWAENAAQACQVIEGLLHQAGHQKVLKGKSMVSEEIALNEHLIAAGYEVLETDLGEYIIQLAGETPSHIIAPAVHKTKEDVDALFAQFHQRSPEARVDIQDLVSEARQRLRQAYHEADVGITGANALVAESGTIVLVTNEGNGDLSAGMPNHHIVVTSIDKLVATLDDAGALLRVLGRSATGQAMSAYTTFFSGPAGAEQRLDLVLVDNGRSDILQGPLWEILKCKRCGACLNHCPVYGAVGGHAYGWVYTGPMGAVLTPLLSNLPSSGHLAAASTLCGRCQQVCPVNVPLPRLLRQIRAKSAQCNGTGSQGRRWLRLWGRLARRPRLHRFAAALAHRFIALGRSPWVRWAPGLAAWQRGRPLPSAARARSSSRSSSATSESADE